MLQKLKDLWEIRKLPRVEISLMRERAAGNDPFFGKLADEFYRDSLRLHPRYLILRRFTAGVAICHLPMSYEEYFGNIEAAARRNIKKATRAGYACEQIDFNDRRSDIAGIRASTDTRQGKLDESFVSGEVEWCQNPISLNQWHDYVYFGVMQADRMWSYAGCCVLGEVCLLEHIFGHADRQPDGVVPMLIAGIAQNLIEKRPQVKYFVYGTYFGARESMRRFKRKFGFLPHCVDWVLDRKE